LCGLALKSDGSLIAWASSSWGLMDVPPGNDFVAISAAACHSLALTPEPSHALAARLRWGDGEEETLVVLE
jgi:hypothetical protein